MSEPELAYMTEDFDLPRWQTQTHVDPLSSSSAHTAQHPAAPYSYSGIPPPPPPQSQSLTGQQQHRLQPLQQSPTGQNRQGPRISQLLEQEQQQGFVASSPYNLSAQPQLNRSASLSGATSGTTLTSRGRRHHPPDDLEGAFHTDSQALSSPRQTASSQLQASLYPSSVPYHQAQSLTGTNSAQNNTASPGGGDVYSDMYYNGSAAGHAPKRSQTQHDTSGSTGSGRSPMRTNTSGAPNTSLLDSYAQQSQYSPTTTNYTSSYVPTSGSGTLPPAPYHTHSRSHSQVKAEPMTPPVTSAYPSGSLGSTTYSPSYGMDSSASPHPPPPRQSSVSSPSTPFPYAHPSQSPGGSQYYSQDQAMQVDVPQHKRRASGFKRVRDARDLRPYVNPQPAGRRMDSTGTYLSPLRQLTTNILDTYHICNPQFRYESTLNPRRVLTKPSKPAHNEGYDNDDYDYILYVNDWLGTEEGHKYLILDILGQGTFGQVVKCQNMKTHEIVAVKVVKNKPAYFNQSMMEVTILELLNNQCDPQDEHHILRLRDSFIHRSHLCLVFELLSSNLYELIKQNQFQGLSTQLVKVFTAQLLDAMTVLKEARLIHCDLKPENILLKTLQSPQIKVIDFGSACHERQTVYTYIQSRFYRSPEVLLGIPYTASIDMWSLGCIAVELFLGLPLFPGTSEYNQITRIVEMLGMPPMYMLDMGKQTNQFFDSYVDHYGQKKHRLKTLEQYSREHNTNEQPGKQYFKANSLPEIINTAPMPTFKSSSRQGHEMEKELNNRASFIDFCQGLLNLNPIERWSPQQARMHPFITGEKFTRPFTPTSQVQQSVSPAAGTTAAPAPGADPKRPYGGLVPSQPKGTRAYQDAASYNHHLAQHQAYTAQAQAATQAANNAFRNPYITPQGSSQSSSSSYAGSQDSTSSGYSSQQSHPQQQYVSSSQLVAAHRGLTRQSSSGQLAVNTSVGSYPSHPSAGGAGGLTVPSNIGPAPPSNAYYSNPRGRANTINQMDTVPPALARLQHMNQDVIAGRNALTPVLNRDDAMREWERRQAGKPPAAQPYPQLEFLQQQAELAAASGLTNWAQQPPPPAGRYPPPTSKLSHSYAPTIVVDDDRQNAVMSNVRAAARPDGSSNTYTTSTTIASPPQVYTGTSTTANRYTSNYPQQQTPTSPFDSLDRRTDIGNMFVPMQPDHFQSYNSPNQQPSQARNVNIVPPPQTVPSFYGGGAAVVGVAQGQSNNGQQRNPFSANNAAQQGQTSEGNRPMDVWPR